MTYDVAAQICNETGLCIPVDPVTALVFIGVQTLVTELNKKGNGFGPNGAIIKGVNTVLNDIKQGGLGPTNDLVRAVETISNDLQNGLGDGNDIVKALKSLQIRM